MKYNLRGPNTQCHDNLICIYNKIEKARKNKMKKTHMFSNKIITFLTP